MIKVYPKKEWKRKVKEEGYSTSFNILGFYSVSSEGEGLVEVPQGSSTGTKLHELGHESFGHIRKEGTWDEAASQEIEAERFSFEKRGKTPNWRVAMPFIWEVVNSDSLRSSHRRKINPLFNLVLEKLEDEGIEVPESDRKELWSFIDKSLEVGGD